jgi:hypothetical protein
MNLNIPFIPFYSSFSPPFMHTMGEREQQQQERRRKETVPFFMCALHYNPSDIVQYHSRSLTARAAPNNK